MRNRQQIPRATFYAALCVSHGAIYATFDVVAGHLGMQQTSLMTLA